jgi:TonB family protein
MEARMSVHRLAWLVFGLYLVLSPMVFAQSAQDSGTAGKPPQDPVASTPPLPAVARDNLAASAALSDPDLSASLGFPVFRPGGPVSKPVVLRKVAPEYSEAARKARYHGTVLLRVVIDVEGKIVNTQVVRGIGMGLDEKAIEAVRKWKFKPAYKDGKPVAVQVSMMLDFRFL